jgi:hypothetical protein
VIAAMPSLQGYESMVEKTIANIKIDIITVTTNSNKTRAVPGNPASISAD